MPRPTRDGHRRTRARNQHQRRPPSGGEKTPVSAGLFRDRPWRCWPQALRRVRAWLEPALFLWRCWRAWSDLPPPPPLQALLDWLSHGYPLMLYDVS
jgi:hypothetical protein